VEARRTIPEVREALKAIAVELLPISPDHAKRVAARVNDMHRRTMKREKADRHQSNITKEMCAAVRRMASNDPKLSQRAIGAHFGIDGGRVNEIINGFRNGKTMEQRIDERRAGVREPWEHKTDTPDLFR